MAEYLIDHIGFTKNEYHSSDNQGVGNLHKNEVVRKNSDYFESFTYENIKLHVSHNSSLLHLDNLDTIYPDSEAFIFLSRHSSGSGIPTLTCHFTGNFSESNTYGGKPRQLGISYPYLQKQYIKGISANRSSVTDYEIIIEATHHGPTSLKKPSFFVEIGSTEKQWADRQAASVVCDNLICILTRKIEKSRCKCVGIALGGTHYPKKFNQLLLQSEFGLAAVAARHNLTSIDESMIDQMVSKSIEKVTYGIVDLKGLGKEKNRILELIQKKNLRLLKV
jgi:D-aminoacyl-tRNA deacylase